MFLGSLRREERALDLDAVDRYAEHVMQGSKGEGVRGLDETPHSATESGRLLAPIPGGGDPGRLAVQVDRLRTGQCPLIAGK